MAILRITSLSSILNPFHLTTTMHFFTIIFPFRLPQHRDSPVRTLRLRDENDHEYLVSIKGLIEGDYPQEGDDVEMIGRWVAVPLSSVRGSTMKWALLFGSDLRRGGGFYWSCSS